MYVPRFLSSVINYKIDTDVVKEKLIPPKITRDRINTIYANEADLLNVALLDITAREWHKANQDNEGNVRDYAALEQLIVLSNLEILNAVLIQQGLSQAQRLKQLNEVAITQMKSLPGMTGLKKLKGEI